jgi:hypothetical protein
MADTAWSIELDQAPAQRGAIRLFSKLRRQPMLTLTSRSRAAIVAALTLAGTAFYLASAEPALALCKYGTPHCVNPNPGPKLLTVGGVKIPESGWVDPDCKYYGNCLSPNSARRVPTGKVPVAKLPQARR